MRFVDVIALLDSAEVEYSIHEHEPLLTMAAVEATGVFDLDVALKTLVFEAGDQIVGALLHGGARVDYRALADAAEVSKSKLKPLASERVETLLGDVPGGVGPFQPPPVIMVCDSAVPALGAVTFGGGRPDRTLEMDAGDVVRLSGARLAPIAKPTPEQVGG